MKKSNLSLEERIEADNPKFRAFRLDRATFLRPVIEGKDDVAFLQELLVKPGEEAKDDSRSEDGNSYVAVRRGIVIGTVTYFPWEDCNGCNWYDNEGVASFSRLAVHPECRGEGIATKMVRAIERIAQKDGAVELAADVPTRDKQMAEFFKIRGYRPVDYIEREVKSLVLSKRFMPNPLMFGHYESILPGFEEEDEEDVENGIEGDRGGLTVSIDP
jgi:GNAT superfamily N-acetyltransferase